MLKCRAIYIALIFLPGCTATNWGRALYEGQRNAAEQYRLLRQPINPPCPVLPEYSRYEKERARATGAATSNVSRPAQGPRQ